MLIIPRSRNQSIVIGENIIVNVVEIDEHEVQISIDYPDGVSVRGGEAVAAVNRPVEELQAAR